VTKRGRLSGVRRTFRRAGNCYITGHMENQPTETEPQGGDESNGAGFRPQSYANLHRQSPLDMLAWYLVAAGIMALAAAGLFIFLRTIHYRDFTLNGAALGRYLLIAGIISYVAGRVIAYYRRFQRRKTERDGE
jgi:hypothetical protein